MVDPGQLPPGQGQDPQDESDLGDLKAKLDLIPAVLAPVSLIGAALAYFGIVRTRVEARFLGLDPEVFGYSYQDHIVRSIAPMLGPLAVTGAALAIGAALQRWAARIVTKTPKKYVPQLVAAVGLAAIALGGAWQWSLGARHSYLAPLLMGVGAALTAIGARASVTKSLPLGMKFALGFVAVFAIFGIVARIAQAHGSERARELVANLEDKPRVTLLSEDVLGLSYDGMYCAQVPDSRFTRRYGGLSLIAQRNGQLVLVPTSFDGSKAVTIVLEESAGLRLEVDATPVFRAAEGKRNTVPEQEESPVSC